jgi:putative SOS response-associated peptidase YedK
MCSRFALFRSKAEILDELTPLLWSENYIPNWNVSPTTHMPVVTAKDHSKSMVSMEWGVKPQWAQRPIVNARSETIFEKPTFRSMTGQGHFALVPMDAYFEWRRDGKNRIPFMIRHTAGSLLCAAGVWEAGESVSRFVILTRPATGELATLHDRMPVFVNLAASDDWLEDGTMDVDAIPTLDMSEIHPRINSVKTNGPSAIEVVPSQLDLF